MSVSQSQLSVATDSLAVWQKVLQNNQGSTYYDPQVLLQNSFTFLTYTKLLLQPLSFIYFSAYVPWSIPCLEFHLPGYPHQNFAGFSNFSRWLKVDLFFEISLDNSSQRQGLPPLSL